MHPRGFTLVEVAVVCAVLGVLAAVALPDLRGSELRVARMDAVEALTRVQTTQEQHRALHGLYATDLAALRGVGVISPQGRYALSLASTGPDGYRATAAARGVQRRDRGCTEITLDVSLGFARAGPTPACWDR